MTTQAPSTHEQAHEYFRKAREQSRLSHAYLLVGAPGTGKVRFGLDFCRSLFCAESGSPACECGTCRSIENGNHAGVTVYRPVEGKQVIDIETIRELCERSHYRRDHTFVAIIEGAERMSIPAMNALLKTLEEPAGDFIIILAVASTGSLLPTIVSRCHRLYLGSGVESSLETEETAQMLGELISRGWGSGDPARAISELIPEAESNRERVKRLLALLLEWARRAMAEADLPALDTLSAFQEQVLDLRRALDGNVSPDLVMEQTVKRARPVGELLTGSIVR